jgi:hypothetical protein
MGNDAGRKERRLLKRQRKRLTQERLHGGSPYRKLNGPGEIVACYVNADWRDAGIATIHVLKRIPGGHAMAAFLVDLWCIGLKDAYGRLDILPSEFDEGLDRARADMEIARIDPALALRLIRGSIRFARQNGFRLPSKYDRWVSLLGDVGDCSSADLSDFGIDGGLRYVGTMEDLRKRLIGCSVEQFMSRKDVHYIIGSPVRSWSADDEDDLNDDVDDADDTDVGREDDEQDYEAELCKAVLSMRARTLEAARQWCFTNGMPPHPRLEDAVHTLFASMAFPEADSGQPASDEDLLEESADNLTRALFSQSADDSGGLDAAMRQLAQFANQFDSPEAFFESLGLLAE